MEKINLLIVEDKPLIAEAIASKLKKHDINVVGIYPTGEEALDSLEQTMPDIVLMDIQLAGKLDGVTTAKMINDSYELPIIYLSDHVDDATVQRAAKTFPANYLAKPFNESDLVRAINIAFTNFAASGKARKSILDNHIFVRVDNAHIKLGYDEIIYLEADGAYCNVVTQSKTYVQSISMNHVLERIRHKDFVRVHRSYVINANKITKIDGNTITLGDHEVVMSKSMREELTGKLNYLK